MESTVFPRSRGVTGQICTSDAITRRAGRCALDQRADGIGDQPLREPAHLREPRRQLAQVFVESGTGVVGHRSVL
jgi:hypothetical protein